MKVHLLFFLFSSFALGLIYLFEKRHVCKDYQVLFDLLFHLRYSLNHNVKLGSPSLTDM